jgi:hypothetical protein
MDILIGVAILLVLSIPFFWSIRRSNELFCLEVTRGKATIRRGHVPPGLLVDIKDVVARPAVRRATIRVVQERGRPRVLLGGKVPEAQEQRLRNVVGAYPVAKIKGGRRARS